jgi:hypothetical protein
MSQSLASAKKRRAPIQNDTIKPNQSPQGSTTNTNYNANTQSGLTLPQVIHLIDKRLTSLEQFASDQKGLNTQIYGTSQEEYNEEDQSSPVLTNIKEVVDEFDKRYDMLAEEIVNLKNIVLTLQSYTMEVNKTLMEERGRIYDEIEKQNNPDLQEE